MGAGNRPVNNVMQPQPVGYRVTAYQALPNSSEDGEEYGWGWVVDDTTHELGLVLSTPYPSSQQYATGVIHCPRLNEQQYEKMRRSLQYFVDHDELLPGSELQGTNRVSPVPPRDGWLGWTTTRYPQQYQVTCLSFSYFETSSSALWQAKLIRSQAAAWLQEMEAMKLLRYPVLPPAQEIHSLERTLRSRSRT